jgi:hypothetical protein
VTERGTYIKMSDSLPEHRKIVTAGGDAAWLHICALAYCSRNLTDGFVPQNMVPRLSDRRQPERLVTKLIDVQLWHGPGHECKRCPQPQPSEYVIHDYLEHQRSAARVAEVSSRRAEAGRRGGTRSKPKPKQVASDLVPSGFADAEANTEPSFTEGVLRTPQTEGSLRDPQADEVPPSADAGKPRAQAKAKQVASRRSSGNAGDIIAAYVEGALAAGQSRPPEDLRKRVGSQANRLLAEGYELDALVASARTMGAGEWNDLAIQVRRDAAAANGSGQGAGTRREAEQAATDALFARNMQREADRGTPMGELT